MNFENYTNLSKDSTIKEKLDKIAEISDVYKQYKALQVLLEYINAYFLTQNMKIKMEDFSIIKIIEKYGKIDEDLYEEMKKVLGLYEDFDSEIIDEDILVLLLIYIDNIFGIILNKYGGLKKAE